MRTLALGLAGLLALLPACGDDDDSSVDAALPLLDAAGADAALLDASRLDAGELDASLLDAGRDASTADLLERLRGLPNVVSVEEGDTGVAGYRYFEILISQPVDHAHPEGARFDQALTLMHRDETAPLLLFTSGYGQGVSNRRVELTRYLNGNQLSVEHRYFTPSRPEPADWSYLTVKQSADDFHAIATSFKNIYTGAWVGNGASKGGMTSVYHRRFYPGDLAGTVAYVAPHSLSDADPRYDTFLNEVVPAECMAKIRATQVDMLANRRGVLEAAALAQAPDWGLHYEVISVPAAVEIAVIELEFAFWQYGGVNRCGDVPDARSSDEDVVDFLSRWSGPDAYADEVSEYYAPYYYQAYTELGYPASAHPHLNALLQFDEADYVGIFPAGVTVPDHDPATMLDVGAWVKAEADDIIFVYGEFDPWTAGAFDIAGNPDVQRYTVANGTHGASITRLADADRALALAELGEWTGVTPIVPLPSDNAAFQKPGEDDERPRAQGLRRR